MRTHRFFRYLWRVNAVLIAVAMAGIALVLIAFNWPFRRNARPIQAAAPPIPGKPPNKELFLGPLAQVERTSVFRARLSTEERVGRKLGSYSGSDSSELHNILIADVAGGTSTWLLPGDKELIASYDDVTDGLQRPPLATVALVKPSNDENAVGRLLIFDIAAQHVEQVAADVRTIDGVTIVPSGDIAVLFQKNRKYYLASFDRATRAKKSEREITIPPLR